MECCLLQNKLTKPLECNQIAIFEHVVANGQIKHDTASCGSEVLVASCKDGCLFSMWY